MSKGLVFQGLTDDILDKAELRRNELAQLKHELDEARQSYCKAAQERAQLRADLEAARAENRRLLEQIEKAWKLLNRWLAGRTESRGHDVVDARAVLFVALALTPPAGGEKVAGEEGEDGG